MNDDLLTEIKKLGNILITDDNGLSLYNFSQKFNAAITYFKDNKEILDIAEHQYIDPVVISVFKCNFMFIVYKISEVREPELAKATPILRDDKYLTALDNIASKATEYLINAKVSSDFNEKLQAIINRMERISSNRKWLFIDYFKDVLAGNAENKA